MKRSGPSARRLWNMHADGLTDEEIAAKVGLTVRQVNSRIKKALVQRSGTAVHTPRSVRERVEIAKDQDPFDQYGMTSKRER